MIKTGQVMNLTDHINTIDPTGNIKFTYEEEEDKQIPFLDTLLVRSVSVATLPGPSIGSNRT